MTRQPPPPLEFPYPPCSICGEECQLDDYWYCPSCGASWPTEGAHLYDGEWTEPKAEQCLSQIRPWEHEERFPNIRDTEYRCVLEDGHRNDGRGADLHRHPEYCDGWKDTDAHVYEVVS